MAVRTAKRTKRTYNLSGRAVDRVRELTSHDSLPRTQDGVVEAAIDRLYESIRYAEDAAKWAEASGDTSFRREMAELAELYRDRESWPA
jgi:hypothetical protein